VSDPIKQLMRRMWGSIDYSVYANLTPTPLMSELLCEAAELRAGHRVLDVATGSGNTAIAAARRWCTVTGIDYVPDILEAARRIASSQGVTATFQPGDAENLEFADASRMSGT
jgi:ubiquinone/menaquinone biosynthesis C-methylase UbiE